MVVVRWRRKYLPLRPKRKEGNQFQTGMRRVKDPNLGYSTCRASDLQLDWGGGLNIDIIYMLELTLLLDIQYQVS